MEFNTSTDQSSNLQTIDLEKEQAATQLTTFKSRAIASAKIEEILAPVDTGDLNTITKFGESIAVKVAQAADVVLNNTNIAQLEKTGNMMTALTKIMSQFDLAEITEEPKGLLHKLFGDAKKQLDKIMNKYTSVGDEIEKIYIELKNYEKEIMDSNVNIERIYDESVAYYQELLAYIEAGTQAVGMIEAEKKRRQELMEKTGDSALSFEITSLDNAKSVMEQRVHDLRTAESNALQSIPMLKMLVYTNAMLNRKINSTFIVTLPVFKQALAQAITARRQQIQAESLKALDEKTNELLIKNAQNIANQGKLATQLAGSSAISVDTLEKTWETIMTGLEETKRLNDELSSRRVEEQKRLAELNDKFWQAANN